LGPPPSEQQPVLALEVFRYRSLGLTLGLPLQENPAILKQA
jgi:hypothetical protein